MDLLEIISTWDVILSSPDFADGANPPANLSSTVPEFLVVQAEQAARFVLVMDVSYR